VAPSHKYILHKNGGSELKLQVTRTTQVTKLNCFPRIKTREFVAVIQGGVSFAILLPLITRTISFWFAIIYVRNTVKPDTQ